MISTVVFHPVETTTNDGWIETGAPLTGAPQPPNRALPAPIFDVGSQYQPNNGTTGNWVIEKTIVSDVAGPGFLTIPAGSYPASGGVYADDQVAAIRLNGVPVPFTGLGTGNIPPQSQPVTWLAGPNVLQIEVRNTVAGGTAVTGRLIASGPGVPCDCCPTGGPRCALVAVPFTGVTQTAAAAGWSQVSLPATIDGITATTALSGYNSPAGTSPTPTPEVTYTLTGPQNRVRGLRLWNQGGSILTDSDGLGTFTADFYAGVTLLTSFNAAGVNGGAPQTLLLPGPAELNGVTRVVLRNLAKLQTGTITPLWRELQLVEIATVFPCRRRSGALEWYDQAGNPVAATDIIPCP
ncbi:hypothetical protein GTY54_43040 [Streptomyces sp. SID625]|nr:hypothetical protein [Streptomyces sp. SID625]